MVDPIFHDPHYRFRHAMFMASWWGDFVCHGVRDPDGVERALAEAIGWASR